MPRFHGGDHIVDRTALEGVHGRGPGMVEMAQLRVVPAQVELALPGKHVRRQTGHLHRSIAVRDFRKGCIRPGIRLIGADGATVFPRHEPRCRRAACDEFQADRGDREGPGELEIAVQVLEPHDFRGQRQRPQFAPRRQRDVVADGVGAVGIASATSSTSLRPRLSADHCAVSRSGVSSTTLVPQRPETRRVWARMRPDSFRLLL